MFSGSSLLIRFTKLLGFGQRGAVGVETIDAGVFQRPFVRRKLGAIGEGDLPGIVVVIVLNQRDVQEGARVGFVSGGDGHLAATARKWRRYRQVPTKGADVIDDAVLDLRKLIVCIRYEAFLQIERDERKNDAD